VTYLVWNFARNIFDSYNFSSRSYRIFAKKSRNNPKSWYLFMVSIHSTPTPSLTYTPNSITSADPSSSNSADSALAIIDSPPHLCRTGLIDSPYCPLHPQSFSICNLNHLFFQCPHLSQLRHTLYIQLLTNKLSPPLHSLWPHLSLQPTCLPTDLLIHLVAPSRNQKSKSFTYFIPVNGPGSQYLIPHFLFY